MIRRGVFRLGLRIVFDPTTQKKSIINRLFETYINRLTYV